MRALTLLAALIAFGDTAGAQVDVPDSLRSEGIGLMQWRTLASGRAVVVDGSTNASLAGQVRGYVLARVAWERAFIVIADHAAYPAWYRSCMQAIDVISTKGGESVTTLKVRERHRSFGITTRYTLDYLHDPLRRQMTWALDTTARNDTFSQYSGAWRLLELGDTATVIVHEFTARTGGWVPQRLQRYFIRRGVPDFLEALKRRTEAAATREAAEP